jgi:hypothetical protein
VYDNVLLSLIERSFLRLEEAVEALGTGLKRPARPRAAAPERSRAHCTVQRLVAQEEMFGVRLGCLQKRCTRVIEPPATGALIPDRDPFAFVP